MTDPVTIMIVDDDEGHARLIEKNLRRSGLKNDMLTFTHGQAALDFVAGRADLPNQPLLMLLDLNMPGLSGHQVLERIKSDARTQHIPIIILTTTEDQREVEKCYGAGANLYLTKPVQYDQFVERVRQLGLMLNLVAVPGGR